MSHTAIPSDIIIRFCDYIELDTTNLSDKFINNFINKFSCPVCNRRLKMKLSLNRYEFNCVCYKWFIYINEYEICEFLNYMKNSDSRIEIWQKVSNKKFTSHIKIHSFGMLETEFTLNRRIIPSNAKRENLLKSINKLLIFK